MKTIKFDDGYAVEIEDQGNVTRNHKGSSQRRHASHWKEVTGEKELSFLKGKGLNPDDYLFSSVCGKGEFLRAGNGVREAVYAAAAESDRVEKEKEAQRKTDRDAKIEESKRACGLTDPVLITVDYFDGAPTWVILGPGENERCSILYVAVRESTHGYWFAERASLDTAKAELRARKLDEINRQEAIIAARKTEFDAKAMEAKQTGKPVVLARWTTDRCMNRHDHECSFDNATRYVLPDGTTRTTYACCY